MSAVSPPWPDPRLQAVAEEMDWVMRFPCRSAPGLAFVGARSSGRGPDGATLPGSHAGGAETPEAAFAACMGEAAEFLAQLSPVDRFAPADDAAPIWTEGAGPFLMGRRLRAAGDAAVRVPAAQVLRGLDPAPSAPLSLGCAAGPSPEAAAVSALLELIERDAAALWWAGGAPARPPDLADPALAEAIARAAAWRDGADSPRRVWALDIRSDLPVPVFAVLSDAAEGGALSVGTAARLEPAEAFLAAARECAQGELALDLVAERRAHHGDAVLGPADHRRLALAALDPAAEPSLAVRGGPRAAPPPAPSDAALILDHLVELLAAHQHSAAIVELTRPRLGPSVIRASIPSLQPWPSEVITPRLAAAQARAEAKGPGAPLH